MVAGIEQGCDRQMHGRLAAGGCDRADAVFQRRQPFLQYRGGRVGDAGIDVAGAFQVEQRRRVVRILEHIGRRLVDWHRAGAGRGIGTLAGVKAQRFKCGWFWRGHETTR